MSEEQAPPGTAQTRTLTLAASTLGGTDQLARHLQVDPASLERWIAGAEPAPHEVFLLALDVVARGPSVDARVKKARRAQAHADRLQASANRLRESAQRVQASAELAQAQAALMRKAARDNDATQVGQVQPKDGAPASNHTAPDEKAKKKG